MAAQTNAADVKAQLAETLGRCRATLSQTEQTLDRLGAEVPPDGCIVPVVHTPDCMFDSIARQQAGTYDVPAVRAAIHRERQSAPVVIFGYELSPFCGRARQMLEDEGVHESQIKIVSLGAAPSLPGRIAEPAMVAELANMYGAGLPCCFVDGESIGDFKQLAAAADDGSLRRRLGDAGALDP